MYLNAEKIFLGELGIWSDAVQCYHDAVDDGLTFDNLWVRSLQALQSLAVTNDKTVPWPVSIYIFVSFYVRSGVGKVRPAGQIRPASSIHPARGGSLVLTVNSARKTYRTMSDCFHAERDLVAH